jgi:hypothetical protein
MDLQTPHRPPVADGVAAPPNQNPRPRRRADSPPTAKTADARPKKRSPNYVHRQTTSPAVISSLIDQLSAISIPANDHFENLLVGYNNGLVASAKTSVHSVSGRNSTAGHDGSSVDCPSALREHNGDFPDDACEPPVIRTSKPPSGFSALTAPKKKDKPHSLGSYIGRNSGSSASLHSTYSNHSVASFGAISIEAGPPRPSVSSERSSIESKRSSKGPMHRGLMYMSSRERLKLKETERKRHTTHNSEDVLSHDSPRKGSVALFSYEDTIKEEPTSREENRPFQAEASRFEQMHPDRSGSPRRLRINLVDGMDCLSPPSPGIIPERGSSLRHSGSPTRKSKKSRTSGANRKEQPKSDKPEPLVEENNIVEQSKPVDEELVMKDKILQELEEEENEVAHRIRVLKEQKLQRDRIAGMQAGNGDAGVATSSMPRVSVVPSPDISPTSIVSSSPENRAPDPAKAHKVLGITRKESPTNAPAATEKAVHKAIVRKPAPEPIVIHQEQAQAMRYARHTGHDGEDLDPLPINYNVAMAKLLELSPPTPTKQAPSREALARETPTREPVQREAPCAGSPPPPSISVASSKESKSTPTTRPRRSSSVVGGRSAVSRKVASSSLLGANLGHQHSSSINNETVSLSALSVKQPPHRSASAEMGVRSHSMMMPLPDSNSLQLQRRKTFTKKRWSHPDLPAKAEKRHNDRIEKAEAAADSGALGIGAVQRPPRPIVEERPASLDPIDIEVESFLNASRLSQKIRHPQTGRIISYSEVGDPNGFAVFVCVGMGLTRYVMAFYDQLAATLKLRLITPDRPGVGGSQIDPTGTPLSWPGELKATLLLQA